VKAHKNLMIHEGTEIEEKKKKPSITRVSGIMVPLF
jgi:hypothetical protein